MVTICIAGKNEIAVNALHYLVNKYPNFNYVVVCNKTDDGITSWQPSLLFTAKRLGVNQVQLEDLYLINNLIFISLEFDSIIKPSLFISHNLFNIHFSALPKYKGMYTSVLPILNAEISSGVTLHKIDKGIDTGDIIDQLTFNIDENTTCKELYQLYLNQSFILFKKNIDSILNDSYSTKKQSKLWSSYYSKKFIDFSNLKLNLNKTAFEIHNQFRAFNFRDYQMLTFNNWKIYKTEITDKKSENKPGTILKEDSKLFVICSVDYNIILHKDYYDILWEASKNGDINQVKSISKFIPDINLRNNKGWNALILAVYNNHHDLAKWLLDNFPSNNCDVNATNYKGTTVIMYALACYQNSGNDTMLKLILKYRPNLNKKDEVEKSIFDYLNNDQKILMLLKNQISKQKETF